MLQGMKILHILRPETPQKCGVLYYQNISLSLTFSLPMDKRKGIIKTQKPIIVVEKNGYP